MSDWQISNPNWSPEAVVAHFGDEGSHAEFYKMLRAVDRDWYLNCGYSRAGRRHWSKKSQIRLVDRLGKRLFRRGPRPITLLDVGCGRGGPAFHAHENWEADVTGIDICPYALERAIGRARRDGILEGVLFRGGNGTNIPFPDGSFSYVWAIESASYMADKAKFFGDIGRVLADDGRFAMADVTVDEAVVGDSRFALDCLGRFLTVWDMPFLESHDRYRERIEAAGMEVTRSEDATPRTLVPHAKRLGRLVRRWDNSLLYKTCAWYVRRKTNANLDLIRDQIEASYEAIESGAIRYGLFWSEKKR